MRLDKYLTDKYGSRTKASTAIRDGLVRVNGKNVSPSYEIKDGDDITFTERELSFVSQGGYKLAKALKDFSYDVSGKIFADIGASTGGFTDCLLQSGAKKVYCIDVGENQLDKSLLDKNIVIIDNFNARELTSDIFAEPLDGIVTDVSFISLTYILDKAALVLPEGRDIIALIKPQFECEGGRVGKNGIVRDPLTHKKVIEKIYNFSVEHNLSPIALTDAPIKADKNKEYLILLRKGGVSVPLNKLLKYVKL